MSTNADNRPPGGKPPATANARACAVRSAAALALPPQPLQCVFTPPRPLLLWDGQCAFCQRSARWIKRLARHRIDCQPYQQRRHDFPEIAPEQFDSAVFLILPDGRAWHSAQAVYRALALRWPLGFILWLYLRFPAFARLSDRRYRAIAASRHCRVP